MALYYHIDNRKYLQHQDSLFRNAIYLFAGETYTFRAYGLDSGLGTVSDPSISLFESYPRKLVAKGKNIGQSQAEELVFTPTQSDSYVFELKGQSAGSAIIRVDSTDDFPNSPKETLRNINARDHVGKIDQRGDADFFRLPRLLVDTQYKIEVELTDSTLSSLDLEFWSSSEAESPVVKRRIGGKPGRKRLIPFQYDNNAILAVRGILGSGKYRIRLIVEDDVTANPKQAPTIEHKEYWEDDGIIVSGKIELPGDTDLYRIRLIEHKWYEFESWSNLSLVDQNGEVLYESRSYGCGDIHRLDPPRLVFGVPKTGQYFLKVSGSNAHSYTVRNGWKTYTPAISSVTATSHGGGYLSLSVPFCDWYDERGGSGTDYRTPQHVQVYRSPSADSLTLKGVKKRREYRHLVNLPVSTNQWNRYQMTGNYSLNRPNALYKRVALNGYWTRWNRDHFFHLPEPEQIDYENRYSSEYDSFIEISFAFADGPPVGFGDSGYSDFQPLSEAQKESYRSIFTRLDQLLHWNDLDDYYYFGFNIRESGVHEADIVIGSADMNGQDFSVMNPGSDRESQILINHQNSDLDSAAPGTKGFWKMLQSVGEVMGLSTDTSGLGADLDNNQYTVMSNKEQGSEYPHFFGWHDLAVLNRTYGGGLNSDQDDFVWTESSPMNSIFSSQVFDASQISSRGSNTTIRLETGSTSEHETASGIKYVATTVGSAKKAIGGAGDDRLIGNNEHNYLIGNAGNDFLTGQQGGDRLFGGAGDDSYFYDLGDGRDVINEAGKGGNDALSIRSWFALDKLEDDISFAKRGNDLVVSLDFNGSTIRSEGSIRIKNMDSPQSQIESLYLLSRHNHTLLPKISLVSVWENLATPDVRMRMRPTDLEHGTNTGLEVVPL